MTKKRSGARNDLILIAESSRVRLRPCGYRFPELSIALFLQELALKQPKMFELSSQSFIKRDLDREIFSICLFVLRQRTEFGEDMVTQNVF